MDGLGVAAGVPLLAAEDGDGGMVAIVRVAVTAAAAVAAAVVAEAEAVAVVVAGAEAVAVGNRIAICLERTDAKSSCVAR
ncbi:MAG: hypothetical protein F6J95_013350 [Leptolyngbya sp. SIO1E4]|nr:hypothetical protein [Leptolyngbya sp. SIO1E4]